MKHQEKEQLIKGIQPIEYFKLTDLCNGCDWQSDKELSELHTQVNYGLAHRKAFVLGCIEKGLVTHEQVKQALKR